MSIYTVGKDVRPDVTEVIYSLPHHKYNEVSSNKVYLFTIKLYFWLILHSSRFVEVGKIGGKLFHLFH